eukprot:SAG31_NODE_173_length_21354_cov_16.826112_2_plen_130_part_00
MACYARCLQLNGEKTAFQRAYSAYISRCHEVSRMLRVLEELIVRHQPPDSVTSFDIREEQRDLFDSASQGRVPLEDELTKLEHDLITMEKNLQAIVVEQVGFSRWSVRAHYPVPLTAGACRCVTWNTFK